MKKLQKFPHIIYNEDGRLSWSARAVAAMPAGAFVSEYVGKTLATDVADKRPNMRQFGIGCHFAVDAAHEGSEARFLAQACKPNCKVVTVYEKGASSLGPYRLFIITLRDIQPGEWLCIDYHAGDLRMFKGERPDGRIDCL